MRPVVLMLFLGCTVFCGGALIAQTGVIRGEVTDALNSEALVGVNIIAENGNGVTTESDGAFSLELPAGGHTITFKYVGYISQSVAVQVFAGDTIALTVRLAMDAGILNTLVVSGSRFEKKLSEETVSIEVIKPTLIANANTVTIDKSIEKIAGVNVIDGQANIRGGSGYSYGAGSRVLLLVDDIPILTADAAFPMWGFVPVENIEQIEIIKGTSSALYGSSALNGVINVRTAYPGSEPQTIASIFSGFYGAPQNAQYNWWGDQSPFFTGADVLHKQRFNKFDLVASTYMLSEDSYLQQDYTRFARLSANTRYRFSDRLSAGINFNTQLNKSVSFFYWHDIDSGLYIPADNTLTYNQGFRLTIDPFITYYDHSDGRHKLMMRYFNADNITQTEQGILSELFYGEYQYQKSLDAVQCVLTGGIVGNFSNVVAELYGDSSYVGSNEALYIQVDKKFGDVLNISGGMRYEWNQLGETNESRPVFRLGANYQIADFTFLRASWGQGYRFPTIAEKYINTNVSAFKIFPNPELESETGWSSELGIKQGFPVGKGQGFVDLAGFFQRYQNMMEFTFGYYPETGALFPYGFKSLNIGNTQIMGFEVSVGGSGNIGTVPVSFVGGYTYIDPIFRDFDSIADTQSSADYNVLKYRFRHTAKMDVEATVRKMRFGAAGYYYSFMEAIDQIFTVFITGLEQYREVNDTGFFVADVRAAYVFNDNFEISVLVNNVFNREYMIRPALSEAPIHYTLKMRVNF